MKNFKDFLLAENSQSWSVKDLIFGEVARTYVHIPLSLPMWKRITEVKNMYGVHSTTINGMEKLVKLQGSSAQISTVDWFWVSFCAKCRNKIPIKHNLDNIIDSFD